MHFVREEEEKLNRETEKLDLEEARLEREIQELQTEVFLSVYFIAFVYNENCFSIMTWNVNQLTLKQLMMLMWKKQQIGMNCVRGKSWWKVYFSANVELFLLIFFVNYLDIPLDEIKDLATHPERIIDLHQKLSSPSRRKINSEKSFLEKQENAQEKRQMFLEEYKKKIQELDKKVYYLKIYWPAFIIILGLTDQGSASSQTAQQPLEAR